MLQFHHFNKLILYYLSFLLFGLVFLSFIPLAQANSYKVTPLIINREVSQRDIFSEKITITNNKSHKINVYASVNEVSVDIGGDIIDFTPRSVADNSMTPTSWISIGRGRLAIEHGETLTIPLAVQIHPEAKPGIYNVFVGFGTGLNRPEAEQQVRGGIAPGVIVSLSVEQKRDEFMKLSSFAIDRFVIETDNTAIRYTLQNPGQTAVVPRGEIIVSNSRGEEVAAIVVNPERQSLAPGQETAFVVPAPTADLLGKYKAFLAVDYGSQQVASVYDTAFFYVLPWQKLALIFAFVMMLALVTTLFLHRRFREQDHYDYDHDQLPVFIKSTRSLDKDHDINLKKNN